jgi:hypothetical protein
VARGSIARPERPVFSKFQFLMVTGTVFFLFLGSVFSHTTAGSYLLGKYLFYFLFFLLGFTGVIVTTPSRLLHLQGLRKNFKLNKRRIPLWDDHATNLGWLAFFFLLGFGVFLFLHREIPFSFTSTLFMRWMLILLFISWFAGALEYFRLGTYHKKPSYFIVAIIFLWVFVPLLGLMISPLLPQYRAMVYFFMTSPVFPFLPEHPFAAMGLIDVKRCLNIATIINTILVITSFSLAAKARNTLFHAAK